MSKILSIETSIAVCSIAIHEDGKLLALSELHQDNVHGGKLVPLIKSLLEQADFSIGSLDAIAVAQGPGSYTGLRIGVSTAKGLAFAHDLPLIGVDSLDGLGWQLVGQVDKGSFIVPMIDARRMEVYAKVLDFKGETVAPLKPVILEEGVFGDFLASGAVYFLGNANKKTEEFLNHTNARYIDKLNSASSIGELAYQKFIVKDFADIAYFEPNYLKEFLVLKSKKNPLLL
ncbi:tRNA (adenosine(37)-N6)-threonylcarbamoyltransferase complex dimerization subunit type 1 TsaB [Cyclobacterium amurskyense]|uniref:Universal protein YeaZ n=1 Tax=Cyclobacterium amurskyense TaxID=320787 RepID=A0A0H4PDR8_9BACT|nr:tRNA (adenosine(37)-N6)-threonylcarbamoyltransferase complex dimerization subunit type 1 TsaB [Cyclobacterium amurskyense]AKP51270.1 Universal protein YeaZ [Cyclobacterium amurskyense]